MLGEYCVNFLQARTILSGFWHGFGVGVSDRKFDVWISSEFPREFRVNFEWILSEFFQSNSNLLHVGYLLKFWMAREIHAKFTRNSHPRLHPRETRNSRKIHTLMYTHAIRVQIRTQFAPTRAPKAKQEFEILWFRRIDTVRKIPNLRSAVPSEVVTVKISIWFFWGSPKFTDLFW